jgi:hypothetical protein
MNNDARHEGGRRVRTGERSEFLHRREEFEDGLLAVAEEHQRVVSREQGVGNPRKSRAEDCA